MKPGREWIGVTSLLVMTFGLRAWRADQPIVENYVGRQVPTAMVARNLERGSGFLHPQLDTGPFPNLFLVEPPIYQSMVVGVRKLAGFELGRAGRLVSAFGFTLGALGLFGLVRRREGPAIAFLATAAFAVLPVGLRYGRAFQPDALMLGLLLSGMNAWDLGERNRRTAWLVLGWLGVAAGLAVKVLGAFVLVPLALAIVLRRRPRDWALLASTLFPALLWYAYAAWLVRHGDGSRATLDSGSIWLRVLVPTALFDLQTYQWVARFLLVRAFTPVGAVLALWGLWRGPRGCAWAYWALGSLAVLAGVAGKLHHEYYWLLLAPAVAVGIGRAVARAWPRPVVGRPSAILLGASFLAWCLPLTASTWTTPEEWAGLPAVVRRVEECIAPVSGLVAREALLYHGNWRGYRLETDGRAAERAAGEWGARLTGDSPLALIETYRRMGARYVADMPAGPIDPERQRLHDAIRDNYVILSDDACALIAELVPRREVAHVQPEPAPRDAP